MWELEKIGGRFRKGRRKKGETKESSLVKFLAKFRGEQESTLSPILHFDFFVFNCDEISWSLSQKHFAQGNKGN
jgi:hypothetical protein